VETREKKSPTKKVKKLILHVGFWTAVSGTLIINFLYNGFLHKKSRNDKASE